MRSKSELKPVVAALAVLLCAAAPAAAQQNESLPDLFAALQDAEGAAADEIVERIQKEWSRSGSPAMDLLLDRAREAMAGGETALALGHLGALIDHAPEFAEGYNARAAAYFQLDRYGEALDDLRMALALNPRHFGAITGLALILEALDRPERALAAWREVERLNPSQEGLAAAMSRLQRAVEGAEI
ncbi:tetratricopeptide repeat protein [Profundibacterium mesophilum]|nr:tetratricopeptide repeat protein [Profundibacterium mesophilum]